MNEYSSIHAREYMTMYENKNHVMVVLANFVNRTQNVVFSCGRKRTRYCRFYLDWRQPLPTITNYLSSFSKLINTRYRNFFVNKLKIETCSILHEKVLWSNPNHRLLSSQYKIAELTTPVCISCSYRAGKKNPSIF